MTSSADPRPERLIVDAQIHIWHNEDAGHPWKPEWRTYAQRGGISPTAEELIAAMDDAGVDRAYLVPPSFTGDDNSAALDAAARYPRRFAVMGRLSLQGQPRPDLAAWCDQPGMVGVRLTLSRGEALDWVTDGTADWFWDAAERADVPVMVYTPERVRQLAAVAERNPGLRLIIDHAGFPMRAPPVPVDSLVAEACSLAAFPNVAVKASAFPCSIDEPYPFPTAQRCTRQLVDAFGPQRVFWGTDLTRLPCSYADAVGYLAAPGGLEGSNLDLAMGHAILEWLGWPGVG